MKTVASFTKGMAKVQKEWKAGRINQALKDVDQLLRDWPDNPSLLIMRSDLIQLSDNGEAPPLAMARESLQRCAKLDVENPQAHLELGHFYLAVEDDAKEAVPHFDRAIDICFRQLKEALTGKAKALAELDKREDALACLAVAYWMQTSQRKNQVGNRRSSRTGPAQPRSKPKSDS